MAVSAHPSGTPRTRAHQKSPSRIITCEVTLITFVEVDVCLCVEGSECSVVGAFKAKILKYTLISSPFVVLNNKPNLDIIFCPRTGHLAIVDFLY